MLLLLFIFSCESDREDTTNLRTNIAFVANQGSGFITIVDINSMAIIDEINLSNKLLNYANNGNLIDEFYINSPRPHYIQPSYDGKFIYVVLTSKNGAIVKLNAKYNVVNFLQITDTEFPAHMQLTQNNKLIYLSTWTTNTNGSPSGVSSTNNYVIQLDHNFQNRKNYLTPAGAHGIKLSPDETQLYIGHDLSDYINIIQINNFETQSPLSSAIPITPSANIDGGASTSIYSPSQVGIAPDNSYAFYACRKSSQILVYDILQADTIGFINLKSLFNVDAAGPYSIEVGPKINYSSSNTKYMYVNFKDGGYFARIKIDNDKLTFNEKFTANTNDKIKLLNNTARPHGLDITDDGKLAVLTSEFSNDNASVSHTFIVDLEKWTLEKTLQTKVQSRGVAIYPSVGN